MSLKFVALALPLSLLALPALAQQRPASPPQTKAESELNGAWQQMVAAAETAAISGPDQLRAAKAAQGALQAWMAEQRQKLADAKKPTLDQKTIAQLNSRIVELQHEADQADQCPHSVASDEAKIAQLGAELARARQACVRPWPGSNSELPMGGMHQPADLPHSTPAPGRK